MFGAMPEMDFVLIGLDAVVNIGHGNKPTGGGFTGPRVHVDFNAGKDVGGCEDFIHTLKVDKEVALVEGKNGDGVDFSAAQELLDVILFCLNKLQNRTVVVLTSVTKTLHMDSPFSFYRSNRVR